MQIKFLDQSQGSYFRRVGVRTPVPLLGTPPVERNFFSELSFLNGNNTFIQKLTDTPLGVAYFHFLTKAILSLLRMPVSNLYMFVIISTNADYSFQLPPIKN